MPETVPILEVGESLGADMVPVSLATADAEDTAGMKGSGGSAVGAKAVEAEGGAAAVVQARRRL